MSDFANFAIKVARASGIEDKVRSILRKITYEQTVFTLEGDPLFDLLSEWAIQNPNRRITNVDLCRELSGLAEKKGSKFAFAGRERAFAQKMTRLRPNLEQFFEIADESGRANKRYFRFKLKPEEEK